MWTLAFGHHEDRTPQAIRALPTNFDRLPKGPGPTTMACVRKGRIAVARRSRSATSKRKSASAKARTSVSRRGASRPSPETNAQTYRHPEATNLARPEAGQQARFRKRKPKVTYRYDSSISPSMEWDG